MRKALLLFVLVLGVSFVSNGQNTNTPKGVVQKFLTALETGNADIMDEIGFNYQKSQYESYQEFTEASNLIQQFVNAGGRAYVGKSRVRGKYVIVKYILSLNGQSKSFDAYTKKIRGVWKIDLSKD